MNDKLNKVEDNLFEELTVEELEDRLELADRCLCRIESKPAD